MYSHNILLFNISTRATHKLKYSSIPWQFIYIYLYVAVYCATTGKLSSSSRLAFFIRWGWVWWGKDVAPLSLVPKFWLPIALERGFGLVATHGHNLSCCKSFVARVLWYCGGSGLCISAVFLLLTYSWQHSCKVIDAYWLSSVPLTQQMRFW